MTIRRLVVFIALLVPSSSFAMSCGIRVVVVNHRPHTVTVQLKSFDAGRTVPAPLPEDFDTPVYSDDVPPYLSSLEEVEIPAGAAVDVKFRRICDGDFWLNWRTVPDTGETTRSGQLQAYDGQSIDVR